jgi:hypothetical protein
MLLNTCLLHDKHVIVSADKAPNNIVLVCKSHYIDCLIKELGIDNSLGKPYINPDDILDNHRSVLCSFGISTKDKKNWIYHHATGFLNYTCVLSNRLYCWICQILHETSFQIINMYSMASE